MNLLRRSATAALVALILTSLAVPNAYAVTIDWVTVGDPGNAPDTTTYGSVANAFQIMKFEFTNQQYTDFLNSVDPNGTNPNSIYDLMMGSDPEGGISFNNGLAAGSKYTAKTNWGDKPVAYVSWFDAARVSNWLMNGATGTSSTETGAYTLVGGQTTGTAPARNSGATYYIPTEDQWYKAAYYKGGSTNAGYWDYATQSDSAPTAVTAGTTGIGSAGSTGNFANYSNAARWIYPAAGSVTTVGTNGGSGYYGAFDMSGNVQEWNDLTGAVASLRGARGGTFVGGAFNVSSGQRTQFAPTSDSRSSLGFRLAAPVPEPGTCVMALTGVACGGYSMWRRRKRA